MSIILILVAVVLLFGDPTTPYPPTPEPYDFVYLVPGESEFDHLLLTEGLVHPPPPSPPPPSEDP